MNYTRFILIGLAAIVLVYLYFGVYENDGRIAQSQWQTKSDEQGSVSVKVTPQILSGAKWKFDVVFDTHSVDLNHDLMQIAELTDDKGGAYKPIAWEGGEPGGHHREGVLLFQQINPMPASVELKIKDVGGVSKRSFIWNIE